MQLLPVPSEYVPTPHRLHIAAPATLNCPLPQGVQAAAETAAEEEDAVPAGHAVQPPCAASEYVPGRQFVQAVAPESA